MVLRKFYVLGSISLSTATASKTGCLLAPDLGKGQVIGLYPGCLGYRMRQTGQENQNQVCFPLSSPVLTVPTFPTFLVFKWGLMSSFYHRNLGQPS